MIKVDWLAAAAASQSTSMLSSEKYSGYASAFRKKPDPHPDMREINEDPKIRI